MTDHVDRLVERALESRQAIAAAGAAGLAASFVLGVLIDDPIEPGAVLYAVPVVLIALALGWPAGAAAGVAASVLFWLAAKWHGTELTAVAFAYRTLALVFLGAVSGAVARRVVETERTTASVREQAAEDLRRSEARLAEAQRIAHIGSWEWDVTADTITWSDELYRIWGVSPDEFEPTYAAYLDLMPADERALADAAVQAAFETHEPFRFRHRVERPDGGVRIVESAGAVFVEDGRVVRMAGVGHDVTERVAAEEAFASAAAEIALQQQLRSRAVELNDAVVQGLAVTRYLLDSGDADGARASADATLERAKTLVADLIGDVELEAGALRRGGPADAQE